MTKYLFAIFVVLVIGAHSQETHSADITIPSNAKVVYGGKGCQPDGSAREPSYRASTNTLYHYSCDRSGRVEAATDRVIQRTVDRTAWQIETSIQHGIDRKIYDMGRKLDKILGRY
jgi:hypothetical protein